MRSRPVILILVAFVTLTIGMSNISAYQNISGPVAIVSQASIPLTQGAVLDDFSASRAINSWNCSTGTFGSTTTATANPGYCTSSWDSAGQALRLDYDVRNLTSYSGYFSQMGGGNLASPTAYTAISFRVKGAAGGEFFKVQLKNNSVTTYVDNNAPATTYFRNTASVLVTDYLVGGVTTVWQKVTIPLHAFLNLDGFSSMRELVIVFEGDQSRSNGIATPQGTVYIDDIRFETAAVTSVKISSFGHKLGVCALGGNIGNFDPIGNAYPTNPSARYTFQTADPVSAPYSMFGEYTVNPGWAGHSFIFGGGNADNNIAAVERPDKMGWIAIPHDFSAFTYLKFSIKSKAAAQNPAVIKIELVDGLGARSIRKFYVPDIWDEWIISLTEFDGLQKSSIKQMNIVYEDWVINAYGGYKVGGIYIDDIRFE